MTEEIMWLTATIALTAVLWVPYIINRIIENGLVTALRNPKPDGAPRADWANRLMHAHANAVENLVIFAPLVLILHVVNIHTSITVTATVMYFFARLAHAVIYTFGIPYLRTVAFFFGFLAQCLLVVTLLSHAM